MPRNSYKNFIMVALLVVGILLWEVVSYGAGNMDETTASIFIKVKERIRVSKKKDMAFADAYQGDPGDIVTANNDGAALFLVTGEKGYTYLVTFPQSSIFLKTGTGDTPDKRIEVKNFTTDLPANLGKLDPTTGEQYFKVGASRAGLLDSQTVASDYQGTFTVRVTYQ